jgi:trimethylamine:corrinoid methyltransferase-like protein
MNLEIIDRVMNEPDIIYKQSRHGKTFYYEKNIGDNYVVIVKHCRQHVKSVATAYKITRGNEYFKKHYCVFRRKDV